MRGKSRQAWVILLCILLTFIIIVPIGNAKIGYSINAIVNDTNSSTFWSRSMITQQLSFSSESKCSGTGNSSKYVTLTGISGMSIKESAYSNQGRLIEKDLLGLTSRVKWIHIEEQGTDNSNRYLADIDVSMPTVIYNTGDLFYRGDGMQTRGSYINGDDKIVTNHYGTSLLKTVQYGGLSNESRILAEVTPNSVDEDVLENRTTAFRLTSASNQYSGLGFVSKDNFMEQIYRGDFKMDTKFITKSKFKYMNDTINETGWLPCCLDKSDELKNWTAQV